MKTHTNKIYLVADQITSWGAGRTRDEAIDDAAQWLCGTHDDNYGRQGISAAEVEEMIISEYESRNGATGVYIIEFASEWPENAEQMDGDQWLRLYRNTVDDE